MRAIAKYATGDDSLYRVVGAQPAQRLAVEPELSSDPAYLNKQKHKLKEGVEAC